MGFAPSRDVGDADYLLRRAVAEADLARDARCPAAAEAHQRIASLYLGESFGDASAPCLSQNDGDVRFRVPADFLAVSVEGGFALPAAVPTDMQALLDKL